MTDAELDADRKTAPGAPEPFVGALWGLVVDEDGCTDGRPSWIEAWLRGQADGAVPDHPTAAALHRILACGVDPDDLTDVVRRMQHELLYNVCQLIDDPGLLGLDLDLAPGGEPGRHLHPLLDEHDPSGRGGEPRGRPIPARIPGQPLYARLAVAHALAGERTKALKVWRQATGAPLGEARAAVELLLDQLRDGPADASSS
ncbi:hypothetical protein [Kitasatospora sp. McL0602]|uniref:hypothetical protein n=1 Tax=Kitasatospora sp. McL0602 TaxID=3439530 RepID=UPI003F8AC960